MGKELFRAGAGPGKQAWPWRRLPGGQPRPSVFYSLFAGDQGPGARVVISAGSSLQCQVSAPPSPADSEVTGVHVELEKHRPWDALGIEGRVTEGFFWA